MNKTYEDTHHTIPCKLCGKDAYALEHEWEGGAVNCRHCGGTFELTDDDKKRLMQEWVDY